MKTCSKCGGNFPLGDYSKDASKPDGHRPDCSSCRRAHREARADSIKVRRSRYYDENRERLLANDKVYREAKRQEIAARKHRYAIEHRAEKRAYNVQYAKDHAARIAKQKKVARGLRIEDVRARDRRYRLEHLDEKKAYHRRWQVANPEKVAAHGHKRRARKAASGGAFTAVEWANLKYHYAHTCLSCGRREPDISLTADHIVPLVAGGTGDIGNIQPLCKRCNFKKHTASTDYRVSLLAQRLLESVAS